ncbi:phytanoyl-CoA dioxygenase family protein [Candidatus Poribacteria bacterium]|nr:phytanoyl-CoA dioxygenase family protein [Candidatus Poribacteria bacterium]MYK16729.1 phytanoyl-CoA dioxygenase family protein [Candidatus Poribacteria bacterium]
MTDQEIKTAYERDGYVVLKDIIDDQDLEPMRDFIKAKVDVYSHELYSEGKLSALYEEESFERRYAAICEELDILPRGWTFGVFGRELYDLYNLPSVLDVVRLLLGTEVSNIGTPALRTKLPRSVITSFPWHQDSQYFDQSVVGKKEKHTGGLHIVTVWVPLVEATVENGCCWVIPGSHRWGLLDGARGADMNVRMEEDVEARGTPVPIPLKPGGALFMSNLTVHTSKVNTTRKSRWSIDFRYFPTPDRAELTAEAREAAQFIKNKQLAGGILPLVVLTEGHKPTWEEWEAEFSALQASRLG